MADCPNCNHGYVMAKDGKGFEVCPDCDGSGWVSHKQAEVIRMRKAEESWRELKRFQRERDSLDRRLNRPRSAKQ